MKTGRASLLSSFGYAINGLAKAIQSERNLQLHLTAVFVVIVAGWYVQLSTYEWCIIVLCCGVVVAAELVNTAIEKMVDLLHPGRDERAGNIKDIAAAAVLVCAIAAAIVGCLIFIPKLLIL